MRSLHYSMSMLCIAAFSIPAVAFGASGRSSIVEVVPALADQFDTMLLFAGKPQELWSRASSLESSIEPVSKLDPLSDNGKWMKSLAALAMMERAVGKSKTPSEKWVEELLEMYLEFAKARAKYRNIACVVSAIELQRGDASAPLAKFAKSLGSLSGYCFQKIKSLAKMELAKGAGGDFKESLLFSLCRAQHGTGDWNGLYKTANELDAIKSTKQSISWIVEALYELGDGDRAQKFLKIASKKNHGVLPRAIVIHRDIYLARQQVTLRNDGVNNGKLAVALDALGDPVLILDTWTPAKVLNLKSPVLDELYAKSLLDDGFRYEDAWKFVSTAKGTPRTSGFWGFRIGAGMAMLLHQLLSPKGSHRMDEGIRKTLAEDLIQLSAGKNRFATRTGFILNLMDVVAGKNAHSLAKTMAGPVVEFVSRNNKDFQALTLAFVVRRFGAGSVDTWKLMEDFIHSSRGKLPPGGVSLLGLAAIENAIETKSSQALEKANARIETQADMDSNMDLKFWSANLTAVRGLLLKGVAQTKQLQRAVNAYSGVLASAANKRGSRLDSQKLCSAGTSLATLMMQGGALEQARGLMEQLAPLCKDYPMSLAVRAVMDIAAGDDSKMEEALSVLNKVVDVLPSFQARLQARLWLALTAKANKNKKMERRHFSQAAKLLRTGMSGADSFILAPDLLSMVAISSNMELSAGYERDDPMRLAIDVGLGVQLTLFPPAAVDRATLSGFLKK